VENRPDDVALSCRDAHAGVLAVAAGRQGATMLAGIGIGIGIIAGVCMVVGAVVLIVAVVATCR
jgi:hypothetical protein